MSIDLRIAGERLLEEAKLAEKLGFDFVSVVERAVRALRLPNKGTLIAGSPEDVVEECVEFDFRFKLERFFEQIQLLGDELLPRLRKEAAGLPA
jgi:hypothetical protein